MATGMAQKTVGLESLRNFLIPVPPLTEQHRIVEKLKSVLPLVEKYNLHQSQVQVCNASIIGILKKSILQDAIQGKLVPQWSEDEPASALLQRIKAEKERLIKEKKIKRDKAESVIFRGDDNCYYEQIGKGVICIQDEIPFEIPDNWVWVSLSKIANLYTGNSISSADKNAHYTNVEGLDYIGTKDVGFDSIITYSNGINIPLEYIKDFKLAKCDDVLMCIEGGSAGRKVGILDKQVCFGNKLCCISSFGILQKYIFYYLQTPSFYECFRTLMTGIIGGVSVNTIKSIRIALPPLSEQQRIVKKIEQLFQMLK